MITQKIVVMSGLIGTVASYIAYQAWQVRSARKKNAELAEQNAKQQTTIQTQKEVIKNGQIKQKHADNVRRSSTSNVDEQLHSKGYFRD